MYFTEQYVGSLNSSDLRDDEHHTATGPLHASAVADQGGGALLGSLLCRVKYGDGITHQTFEAGTTNLAQLLALWTEECTRRGQDRVWLPIRAAWDIEASFALYRRVAQGSLAYWLDGNCKTCNGAKVNKDRRTCTCCAGTGRAEIAGGRLESDLIRDMVSELEGIFQSHGGRAAVLLRRAA